MLKSLFSACSGRASMSTLCRSLIYSTRYPTLSPIFSIARQSLLPSSVMGSLISRHMATLNQVIRGCRKPTLSKPISPALHGCPQRRGVVLKLFAVKPRKPNSAQRKVARVKLTTGKTIQAYIPGEGHNLQEHSVVLVRGGHVSDCPGVNYKVVRGSLDCQGVVNRRQARSKYGVKKLKTEDAKKKK